MPKGHDRMGGDGGDKVVFLAFSNSNLSDDADVSMSACSHCRNKTYTLTYDSHSGFPMMKCAACGQHIGRIGWADEPDEKVCG